MKKKSFSSEANAKAGVKRQGLQYVPCRHEKRISMKNGTKSTVWVPVFKPELEEDRRELLNRGWDVE